MENTSSRREETTTTETTLASYIDDSYIIKSPCYCLEVVLSAFYKCLGLDYVMRNSASNTSSTDHEHSSSQDVNDEYDDEEGSLNTEIEKKISEDSFDNPSLRRTKKAVIKKPPKKPISSGGGGQINYASS